jgi:hypothetical protein
MQIKIEQYQLVKEKNRKNINIFMHNQLITYGWARSASPLSSEAVARRLFPGRPTARCG